MSRLASVQDFEQGGLYFPPYQRFPFFGTRADTLRGRFQTVKILIAGCGWGYTVDELVQRGADAWGVDASSYAIDRSVVPARTRLGDCSVKADMDAIRTVAGLRGNKFFDVIVTEDLLTCCESEAEVQTMMTTLRASGTLLVHILSVTDGTPRDLADYCAPGLLWRTPDQWRTIVGGDLLLDPMGRVI